MYKHCTTEESVLRQRQLEGCLLQLMHTVPYPQITITDICDRAGISRKSFYRYFGSKDGCLCAMIDHCIMDGASWYLPEHHEKPQSHALFECFFEYWKRMSPLLDALARNNLSINLVQQMMAYVDSEERDFHYYLGGSADDSYEQILFMVSGLMGLVLSWHYSGFQKSPFQMASIMEKIIQK
jgi:AcrR family transcriptional regulator